MRKAVVAGLALVLVSAAAFAAIRIGVYDVCPLTGRPLHRSVTSCPATPECPYEDERCESRVPATGIAAASVDHSAAAAAVAAEATAQRRSHCCPCSEKRECLQQAQVENKPATPPAQPESRP